MVSASATRAADGSAVHLSLANTSPAQAVTLTVKLAGLTPKSVAGRVLTAPAIDAHNTFEAPERGAAGGLRRRDRQGRHAGGEAAREVGGRPGPEVGRYAGRAAQPERLRRRGEDIMRKLWFAAAAVALWPCVATSAPVKVEGGLLEGVAAEGLTVYKGIPFAAPPVGELRWRRAAAAAPLDGRAHRRPLRGRLRAVDGQPAPGRRQRGLPVPERLDASEGRFRSAAGAGLDLRRRLQRRARRRSRSTTVRGSPGAASCSSASRTAWESWASTRTPS